MDCSELVSDRYEGFQSIVLVHIFSSTSLQRLIDSNPLALALTFVAAVLSEHSVMKLLLSMELLDCFSLSSKQATSAC